MSMRMDRSGGRTAEGMLAVVVTVRLANISTNPDNDQTIGYANHWGSLYVCSIKNQGYEIDARTKSTTVKVMFDSAI